MKKVLIFLVFSGICLNAYPFLMWSPKTKEWKNPKYAPLATPKLQYDQALKDFEIKDYENAEVEFRKLLKHYPDSKEAADGQYYLGRCYEETLRPFQAFTEYQKIIDSYPNSQRITEVVKRQYDIGEYFLNRDPKKWLGVSWYDFVEHPAILIFKSIVDKAPYSEYASKAQYKLGMLYLQLARYTESREAFQKVMDNYPDSEWASPAKYQLAIATGKASMGTDYDLTAVKAAKNSLDDFVKQHPDADISPQAKAQLDVLRDQEAKKNFDTAAFYEKQGKKEAAKMYYQMTIDGYPGTSYADRAKKKIEQLGRK